MKIIPAWWKVKAWWKAWIESVNWTSPTKNDGNKNTVSRCIDSTTKYKKKLSKNITSVVKTVLTCTKEKNITDLCFPQTQKI